jgi:plasmid stabilization system protein ParE
MAEVSLHVAAEAEYEAALAWYLARSRQAAAGFVAAFDQAVAAVARFPEAFPLRDDNHRSYGLRKYPYSLVYRVDGEWVLVVAVPHDRQLPGYWIGRT